ncbi:MAG: ThuA domain-containing protein [Planctomycetes bacterium]|nr:ThuA domain-containing protein [Planctomycetota bacterium]
MHRTLPDIGRLVVLLLGGVLLSCLGTDRLCAADDQPIRVLVWDEQQPAQKQVYENFLGNQIAGFLARQPGLTVISRKQDDPQQGLVDAELDNTDVLVWWGHVRQREIKPETGQKIVERIKRGQLSLLALHSAHWATPFIEAMNERAVLDAMAKLPADERARARVEAIRPEKYAAPSRNDPLTPTVDRIVEGDGKILLKVRLPNCCFPAYRGDGKPSHVRVLLPKHPLAKGVPEQFDIPHTEMYDEPFHVPPADEYVFQESWDAGEKFRSGSVWKIGRGRVVYFRPGHETFDVFKQPEVLQILDNAVRWLAAEQRTPAN